MKSLKKFGLINFWIVGKGILFVMLLEIWSFLVWYFSLQQLILESSSGIFQSINNILRIRLSSTYGQTLIVIVKRLIFCEPAQQILFPIGAYNFARFRSLHLTLPPLSAESLPVSFNVVAMSKREIIASQLVSCLLSIFLHLFAELVLFLHFI